MSPKRCPPKSMVLPHPEVNSTVCAPSPNNSNTLHLYNYLLGAGILEEKPPRDPGLKERGPNSFKQKPRSSLTSKTPSRTCIARRPPSMMRSALFGLQTSHPGLNVSFQNLGTPS